jgi:hypothetical protein
MHTLPRHLYSPHSPSLLSSTPPPHQPLVAPLFSPAFPSSYSFNENGTPLVRERVLTHSCGRVHHESSPMPSLSLSLSRDHVIVVPITLVFFIGNRHYLCMSHIVGQVRPSYSPPFGRRSTGTHLPSYSLSCFG